MTSSEDRHNMDDEGRGNTMANACIQTHVDHHLKMNFVHPVDEWPKILIDQW